MELESHMCSATTLPRLDLDQETPEAKMHGMSADISDICEFEFYDWVMFNNSQATFPETKFHVGYWLGPAVDIGSALTYKILKSNGQVVPRSTIRHLTLEEATSSDQIALHKAFDDSIVQKIGAPATESDFNVDYMMPPYDRYDDDHQEGTPNAPPEDEVPISEIGDNYLNMVAGGHMIDTPKCMTYSSVVGRETVRIALTIAALNNLQVKLGDVMNAYVTAHCSEDI